MKNIIEQVGILENVDYFDTSRMGNPRYTASVNGFEFFTAVDSSYGYSITNYRDCVVKVTAGMHRGKMTLRSIEKVNK